jgi:hypothetical protein
MCPIMTPETAAEEACYCCGPSVPVEHLARMLSHPAVAVCAGCAQWLATWSRSLLRAVPVLHPEDLDASLLFWEAAGFEMHRFGEDLASGTREGLEVHLVLDRPNGRDSGGAYIRVPRRRRHMRPQIGTPDCPQPTGLTNAPARGPPLCTSTTPPAARPRWRRRPTRAGASSCAAPGSPTGPRHWTQTVFTAASIGQREWDLRSSREESGIVVRAYVRRLASVRRMPFGVN